MNGREVRDGGRVSAALEAEGAHDGGVKGRFGRRSLLQAGLVALGATAAEAVRGGNPAEAGRVTMFVDESNVGAVTTALRSDVAQETFLVENRAPGGGGRAAVYGYLGTPAENRPSLSVNAGVAGVSNAGGAGVYGFAGTASDVGVSAESPSNGVALRVKGRSLFTGIISADDGSGIKKLNATNITSGKLSDSRLSSNIPRRDAASNVFSGKLFAHESIGTPKLNVGTVDTTVAIADAIVTDQMRVGTIAGRVAGRAPAWVAGGSAVITKASEKTFVDVSEPTYEPGKTAVFAMIQSLVPDLGVFPLYILPRGKGKFTLSLGSAPDEDVSVSYIVVELA